MEFLTELTTAITSGLTAFQGFINQQLEKNNKYLEELHWVPNGSLVQVINVLIQQHEELQATESDSNKDLTRMVDYVLSKSNDKNSGEPLHQAIRLKKIQLALWMLKWDKRKSHVHESESTPKPFDCNRRDNDGQTLLSLAIQTKDEELLREVLAMKPEIHAASKLGKSGQLMQPLHLAVLLNFTEGTRQLIQAGAQLTNPAGPLKETPLILAACAGAIDSLDILLTQPLEKLDIEAENLDLHPVLKTGHQAIEVLCKQMSTSKNRSESLRGIAMLLCNGAEPPRDEAMRALLSSNRKVLLKTIHAYLEQKPELVDNFVTRCHQCGSALHDIVYAEHSWGSSVRRFFGRPSDIAFTLEGLVSKKYKSATTNLTLFARKTADSKPLTAENSLKLYAEFVRRYKLAYDGQIITNSWSTMRWMIAEGRCDWQIVERYVKNNPKSRARIVYDEMLLASQVDLHEDNDRLVTEKTVLNA